MNALVNGDRVGGGVVDVDVGGNGGGSDNDDDTTVAVLLVFFRKFFPR